MLEVLIEVRGGVAYVVQKSSGVRLEIQDYDNAAPDGEPLADIYSCGAEIDDGKYTP
jgi:hypothetical protein